MSGPAYLLGLYEKALPELPWAEKLGAAREAGFDYLELSVDETDARLSRLDWTPADRKQLALAASEADLPIRSLCLSGHRRFALGATDDGQRARALEIMRRALDLADALGVRYIQLAGYDVYYEPSTPKTLDRFVQNLRVCAELAGRQGVVLAFETMETPFMNTVTKAMAFVRQVGSPYLQVYPDAGNLTNAALQTGVSVADDLRVGTGHLVAAHLKETVPGVFREVPFGTGHVDFAGVVDVLWTLGVRRYVAEMWFTGAADWQADVRQAAHLLRPLLDGHRDTPLGAGPFVDG